MEPAVAAALVAGGWTAVATLGTQALAGRREAARDRAQAQREERNQRWDTNRERLIEVRALLDASAVALIASEKAVADLRTAVMLLEEMEIEVPRDKVDKLAALDREVDELEGRLALRLGSTHPVTRSFTLASHSLSDAYLRLTSVEASHAAARQPGVSRESGSEFAAALDKAQRDARQHRQQFFERALSLVGVQGPLHDAAAPRALPADGTGNRADA